MSNNRKDIIEQIGKDRKSTVITYVTSTRPNLEVQMAMDSVRKVYEHLRECKENSNIDLFLVSNGGDGTVPWRLVTLIREYAKKFSVLIPFRAFSAATLTALGADEIVMHPMAMLGPTDPTVANPFNPEDRTGKKIGISVEDVTAYIALIKEDVGITHEDELVLAFNHLASQIHPLALGNVKRSLSQSRMMAQKLLSLHMDTVEHNHKINEIVDKLTSKLYFHGHPINRKEAKENIGLTTIKYASEDTERQIWDLFQEYETEMKLEEPFDAPAEFAAQFPNATPGKAEITPANTLNLAFIDSILRSDASKFEYQITGTKQANGALQAQVIRNKQYWQSTPW